MTKRIAFGMVLALFVLAGSARAEQRLAFKEGQWVKLAKPAMGTPEGEIALIQQYLEQHKYGKALDLAKEFQKRYPGDERNEEALFLSGQAEMDRGRYWQAFKLFDKQLEQYSTGAFFERALEREIVIADAFLAGKRRPLWGIFMIRAYDDGLEILERVAERFPGSSLAEQAMMKIAEYHYDHRQWGEAADAYQRYIELFGRRYRSEYAEYRAAQATLNSYKGPEFDDTPLLEAQPKFEAYMAHYPAQAREYNVSDVLDDIERQKARKDYETARFYTRVGKPGPAAFYHRQVVQLYPATPWADYSRQTLGLPLLGAPEPEPEPLMTEPAVEEAAPPEPLEQLAPATRPSEQGQSQ